MRGTIKTHKQLERKLNILFPNFYHLIYKLIFVKLFKKIYVNNLEIYTSAEWLERSAKGFY